MFSKRFDFYLNALKLRFLFVSPAVIDPGTINKSYVEIIGVGSYLIMLILICLTIIRTMCGFYMKLMKFL